MCSVADRLGGARLEWLRTLSVGGFAGDEELGLRLVDQAVTLGRLEAGVVEPAEVGRQRGVGCCSGMTSMTPSVPPGRDPRARPRRAGRDGRARETICRTGRRHDRESA